MTDDARPTKDALISVWSIMQYLEKDRYMTKRELSKYLSLSIGSIQKQINLMPHFKVGHKVLFKKSEIDKWMETNRVSRGISDVLVNAHGEVDPGDYLEKVMFKVIAKTQGLIRAQEWIERSRRARDGWARKKQERMKKQNS